MQSTKLLVATMEAHTRPKPDSPQSQELKEQQMPVRRQSVDRMERAQESKEEEQAKVFISNGLRQRLHGLVTALSWTLGQVPTDAEATGETLEGSNTGSSKTPQNAATTSARRASEGSANPQPRSRISASGASLRPGRSGGDQPADAPCAAPCPSPPPLHGQDMGKSNRHFAAPNAAPPLTNGAPGMRSPQSNGRTMTPQPASAQAPAHPGNFMANWQQDGRMNCSAMAQAGRRPMNSVPVSRGGSPPVGLAQQRNTMPRPHTMSASASPFQPPAHRSPQVVLSQRPGTVQLRR